MTPLFPSDETIALEQAALQESDEIVITDPIITPFVRGMIREGFAVKKTKGGCDLLDKCPRCSGSYLYTFIKDRAEILHCPFCRAKGFAAFPVIKATLVTDAHGYDDFDIEGLALVHRACAPRNPRRGDLFNVYCAGGMKLGAFWDRNLTRSLINLSLTNPLYLAAVEESAASGNLAGAAAALSDHLRSTDPSMVASHAEAAK